MIKLFEGGKAVSLDDILLNREWRVAIQTQLLAKHQPQSLVALKLNIPGSIKNSQLLRYIFYQGLMALTADLQPSHQLVFANRSTGPEAFLCLECSAKACKQKTIYFEENFSLGRLFDADVLQPDAQQLSRTALGAPPRSCFVCCKPAKVCSRSQNHDAQEIITQLSDAVATFFQQEKQRMVGTAIKALLYEVSVLPKPGLVDPASQGSHPDMDVFTFIDSATSLAPYFAALFDLTINWTGSLPALFAAARGEGIKAERQMFAATAGVNTHKGAIFSLGLVYIASIYQCFTDLSCSEIIRAMTKGITQTDFAKLASKPSLTAGEQQFLDYGFKGVRGEAEKGFPQVFELALPYLKQRQGTINQRLLDTLMTVSTQIQDSNLIKRAGNLAVVETLQTQVQTFFDLGGAKTPQGIAYLQTLDAAFISQNLSLGGTADLLIVTIFLALLDGSLGKENR
ncbi:triphosphoribosyl-dephospho-CoA synthase CitG [Streptococcus halichoeri]|uniref:triphosphoribosyl-dephospho-CoA synthase CitG n=1 Tax=Streptococcus halichoeri TaxID=254785 RepID=UPI0013589E98|nr:triphosphoribosyl-dephospho-CoA synthase CitG [Streptococcus halichoeri]